MTSLGDRMKLYELATRGCLPMRSYLMIRVDGRAFHTHLRGAEKPFDDAVATAMNAVAVELCTEIQGACFAYVQSDECSVLATDIGGSAQAQLWFGGVVQKIVSVSASLATGAFNSAYAHPRGRLAAFDSRVFSLSDRSEVASYFMWRQSDAVRNSISMAAQANFSHGRLQHVTSNQMQELLWAERGINWNDYPAGHRRGRVCVRESGECATSYVDGRTGQEVTTTAVRSWWATRDAPVFNFVAQEFLDRNIPAPDNPFKSVEQTGQPT